MARKAKAKPRGKPRKKGGKNRAAPKGKARSGKKQIDAKVFNDGMHDFTNLATALRAYLELLASQGNLNEKQTLWLARSREQVEMLIDLVRELKEKL